MISGSGRGQEVSVYPDWVKFGQLPFRWSDFVRCLEHRVEKGALKKKTKPRRAKKKTVPRVPLALSPDPRPDSFKT